MTISEFISKYGQFFPIEIVEGTAFSFDDEPDIEWFSKDIRKTFNLETSQWEALKNPVIDDGSTKGLEIALEKTGLFIRFRPPGEKWLYYPVEITVVQTMSGVTVPNEAIEAANFYID